jgi:hypothetical protein
MTSQTDPGLAVYQATARPERHRGGLTLLTQAMTAELFVQAWAATHRRASPHPVARHIAGRVAGIGRDAGTANRLPAGE